MFKVLKEECEPTLGSKYSAAVDLYASEDVIIDTGETAIVGLGVCIDKDYIFEHMIDKSVASLGLTDQEIIEHERLEKFKASHYLQLNPRSSLRARGIISNTGIIDLDFVPSCKIGYPINNGKCQWFKQKKSIVMENKCENCEHFDQCEIKIIIHNPLGRLEHYQDFTDQSKEPFEIKKGDRIAQIILMEHKSHLFGINTEDKRTGGFGSTGN